jgi:hypothetical protein
MRRRDKTLLILGVVLTLIVAARAALPYAIENVINRHLAAVEGYDGHIEDVDLGLLRGAVAVEGIHIVRTTDSRENEPFFDCDRMDLAIEWKSLFKGSLVAQGNAWRPVLNLVQAKDEDEQQLGTETKWPTYLADYYPFDINTFRVHDGTVRLRTPQIPAEEALVARNVNAVVSNLTNVVESDKETFARFEVLASVLGDSPLRIDGSVNPTAQQPTFDVNLELESVALPDLNAWLRQYAKADAEAGTFQLYMEIAAAEGRFQGYAKPLMQNVDIYGAQERNDSLLRKAWEGLVEFASNIVENEEEDQVGARVPFSGTIDDPDTSIWRTIASVLRNAFVIAFARSLEGSVSIGDVRKNLSEIDGSSGISVDEKQDDEDGKSNDQKRDRDDRAIKRGPRASG